MVAQALDVEFGLWSNLVLPLLSIRIVRASLREVLPDHDSELVADLVELVHLVHSPAPNSEHVRTKIKCLVKPLLVPFTSNRRREGVVRNPVEALCVNLLAVYFELERFAHLVLLAKQLDVSEADLDGLDVQKDVVVLAFRNSCAEFK